MKFIISAEALTNELKSSIYAGLEQHSLAKIGTSEKGEPISFIANHHDGDFAGVIVVEMFWGALHIKYLFVQSVYRKQGLGRLLMDQALKFGADQKCPFAFVETMSFQALDFYLKMGFQLELTRSGYSHGTSFHYLRKDLGAL